MLLIFLNYILTTDCAILNSIVYINNSVNFFRAIGKSLNLNLSLDVHVHTCTYTYKYLRINMLQKKLNETIDIFKGKDKLLF